MGPQINCKMSTSSAPQSISLDRCRKQRPSDTSRHAASSKDRHNNVGLILRRAAFFLRRCAQSCLGKSRKAMAALLQGGTTGLLAFIKLCLLDLKPPRVLKSSSSLAGLIIAQLASLKPSRALLFDLQPRRACCAGSEGSLEVLELRRPPTTLLGNNQYRWNSVLRFCSL